MHLRRLGLRPPALRHLRAQPRSPRDGPGGVVSVYRRPALVRLDCLPGAGEMGVCDGCRAPLTGRRRRWCSDECGERYFRDHSWQFARHHALDRDGACVWCGDTSSLEVDHIEAAKGSHAKHSCAHHVTNLRTLCHVCHAKRTAEQRRAS